MWAQIVLLFWILAPPPIRHAFGNRHVAMRFWKEEGFLAQRIFLRLRDLNLVAVALVRCAALQTSREAAGSGGRFTAFLLETDIPACLRRRALETLGGLLYFS